MHLRSLRVWKIPHCYGRCCLQIPTSCPCWRSAIRPWRRHCSVETSVSWVFICVRRFWVCLSSALIKGSHRFLTSWVARCQLIDAADKRCQLGVLTEVPLFLTRLFLTRWACFSCLAFWIVSVPYFEISGAWLCWASMNTSGSAPDSYAKTLWIQFPVMVLHLLRPRAH